SARLVAERADGCAADNAWVAGLLAPLGWLAAAAVDPAQTSACLEDPAAAPQRAWGLDPAAIARRLSHAWRLPAWLASVCGHLALPAAVAQALGGDPPLFQTVQLAVGLVQQQGAGLALPVGSPPAEAAAALGLTPAEVEELRAAIATLQPQARGLQPPGLEPLKWEPP